MRALLLRLFGFRIREYGDTIEVRIPRWMNADKAAGVLATRMTSDARDAGVRVLIERYGRLIRFTRQGWRPVGRV